MRHRFGPALQRGMAVSAMRSHRREARGDCVECGEFSPLFPRRLVAVSLPRIPVAFLRLLTFRAADKSAGAKRGELPALHTEPLRSTTRATLSRHRQDCRCCYNHGRYAEVATKAAVLRVGDPRSQRRARRLCHVEGEVGIKERNVAAVLSKNTINARCIYGENLATRMRLVDEHENGAVFGIEFECVFGDGLACIIYRRFLQRLAHSSVITKSKLESWVMSWFMLFGES